MNKKIDDKQIFTFHLPNKGLNCTEKLTSKFERSKSALDKIKDTNFGGQTLPKNDTLFSSKEIPKDFTFK